MEIRPVRESEVDQMIELMCLVFRAIGHARYRQYMVGDPTYQRDQTRVVVDGGEIVATLRVWDRRQRVGGTPVRMGGIGNVCTHPRARGRGYASALMEDAVHYMRESGYIISCLFSEVGNHFYHRFGYRGVPLDGFRLSRWQLAAAGGDNAWEVTPFDEERDLGAAVALHETHNRARSGSLVRSEAYWKSGNVRARGMHPQLVARWGGVLGGYLTFQEADGEVGVLDVAHREESGVLTALADQLIRRCAAAGLETIHGMLPQRHPLVDALLDLGGGDLTSAGNSQMMLNTLDMRALLEQILPELQQRHDQSGRHLAAGTTVVVQADGQSCVLTLDATRRLRLGGINERVADADADADTVTLTGELFWRLLLGVSGWRDLQPTLRERGVAVGPEADGLLQVLFPTNEPIFWQADHF